jgi:hypothetical protein
VEEPVLVSGKDVLECPDTQVPGRASAYFHDLFPEFFSLTVILLVGDILRVKMHGLRDKRDKSPRKGLHLFLFDEVLLQFLQIPQEMGITVLDVERQFIIGVIPACLCRARQTGPPRARREDSSLRRCPSAQRLIWCS